MYREISPKLAEFVQFWAQLFHAAALLFQNRISAEVLHLICQSHVKFRTGAPNAAECNSVHGVSHKSKHVLNACPNFASALGFFGAAISLLAILISIPTALRPAQIGMKVCAAPFPELMDTKNSRTMEKPGEKKYGNNQGETGRAHSL